MSRYVCPCEGPDAEENIASPDELCDDAAYPPKGVRVCRRHGVDPCHDDAWHLHPEDVDLHDGRLPSHPVTPDDRRKEINVNDVRMAIQDTFGEWWESDPNEATDEEVEAIHRIVANTLTAADAYLSIDVGAKTRYFPTRNIVQVEVDVRDAQDER